MNDIEKRMVEKLGLTEESFKHDETSLLQRVTSLEAEVVQLKSFVNSLGKTELVGEGTYENPFTDDSNPINNAYYLRDGQKYVYMDGNWGLVDW